MQQLTSKDKAAIMAVPTQHANLPQAYTAAVQALANCEQVDECKTWIDKTSALASYAKQAKDDTLFKHAQRINTRAWRRAGMLLAQVEPQSNAQLKQYRQDAGVPSVTRTQAATEAGLSERQRKTALRVANIPQGSFEEQVESDDPPTVSALAEQGTEKRVIVHDVIGGVDPEEHKAAAQVIGAIYEFSRATEKYPDPSIVWRGLQHRERDHLPAMIRQIDAWMDELAVSQNEG